jgi:rod shape-determining protein MreD
MIVTRKIAIRIALIVLLAVIVQVSFFSYLSFLGATPNVIPVIVVSLGLLGGALVGAVCGFAAGFLLDSLLLQTVGVSSLVLLSIGYLAGRYREGIEITNWLIPPLLAGGFTLLAAAGFAAVQLLLGVDATVSVVFVREIVVQGLLAIVLAMIFYPLIRRLLAPALIDYAPSHRLLVPGLRRRRGRAGRRRATASAATGHDARVRSRAPTRRRMPRRAIG